MSSQWFLSSHLQPLAVATGHHPSQSWTVGHLEGCGAHPHSSGQSDLWGSQRGLSLSASALIMSKLPNPDLPLPLPSGRCQCPASNKSTGRLGATTTRHLSHHGPNRNSRQAVGYCNVSPCAHNTGTVNEWSTFEGSTQLAETIVR